MPHSEAKFEQNAHNYRASSLNRVTLIAVTFAIPAVQIFGHSEAIARQAAWMLKVISSLLPAFFFSCPRNKRRQPQGKLLKFFPPKWWGSHNYHHKKFWLQPCPCTLLPWEKKKKWQRQNKCTKRNVPTVSSSKQTYGLRMSHDLKYCSYLTLWTVDRHQKTY